MRILRLMRFLLPDYLFELGAVGGYHLGLGFGRAYHHGYLVVVRADERLAALKLRYGAYLRARELQRLLDISRLIRLEVEDYLVLGVVNYGSAILAVVEREEVREVLRGRYGRAAVAAYDLEYLEAELGCHAVGACAYELPYLVDEDGLALGAVGLYLIPDVVQRYEHTDGQQLALQLGEVEHYVLVAQVHVRRAVEGLRRAGHEAADDGGEPCRHGVGFQVLVQVAEYGHGLHTRRVGCMVCVDRGVVVVDAEVRVGLYERLVEHLLLLVGHIRYEQAEEGHELLYLAREERVRLRVIYAVEQLHLRRERVAYLHDVDAVRRTGRYADELTADTVARAPELVTLDGRYDEALYAAHPHAQGKKL